MLVLGHAPAEHVRLGGGAQLLTFAAGGGAGGILRKFATALLHEDLGLAVHLLERLRFDCVGSVAACVLILH